ncbi:MAG: M23 family metallopeptidase [bacterium]|nr:M23 family metallopeptidase [bacterium]
MGSNWRRLRNLVVLGLLLWATVGGVPYRERSPSSDAGPVLTAPDEPLAQPVAIDPVAALPPEAEAEDGGQGGAAAGHTSHVVAQGETLSLLASRYRVEVATIASFNGLANPNFIRAGQLLLIPSGGGSTYRVRPGDTLWDLSRSFGVSQQTLAEANGLRNPSLLAVGQTLIIPATGGVPAGGTTTTFIWPLLGRITSPFGPRGGKLHTGIDIAGATGTPIRAAAAGTVITTGWVGAYGRTVMIRHSGGTVTLYAHASELLVRRGQQVTQGQIIARVGSSGNSTGPHLHFEIIVADRPRNPQDYLPRR